MKHVGYIFTIFVAGAIVFFGYGRRETRTSAAGPQFTPDTVSVDGTYPGVHTYEVKLVGCDPNRRYRLSASCSCVKLVKPAGAFHVPPGRPVLVRFSYDSPDARQAQQAVYLTDADTNDLLLRLPVEGRVLGILENDAPLAVTLHRRFSNEPSSGHLELKTRPGVEVDDGNSEASWLDAGVKTDQAGIGIGLHVGRDLPDGEYTAPVYFDFHGKEFSGRDTHNLTVSLKSDVNVVPSQVWLGRVKVRGEAKGSVHLIFSRDSHLAVASGSSNTMIVESRPSADGLWVSFRTDSGTHAGLFSGEILVRSGAQIVDHIRLAGFASE